MRLISSSRVGACGCWGAAEASWAFGPVAGGLIYDTFGTYEWLYVGACGIGVGAFLIALTFRPFAKSQPLPA